MNYKAISIHQPHAQLIVEGIKHFETRPRNCNYRGEVIICSTIKPSTRQQQLFTKRVEELNKEFGFNLDYKSLSFGCIIGLVKIVDCTKMTPDFIASQSPQELACGNWYKGLYAIRLEVIKKLIPMRVKGQQGVPFNLNLAFDLTDDQYHLGV